MGSVEEGDPFHFLIEDRDGPMIDESLAAALLRLNDPKYFLSQYTRLQERC